MGLRFRQLLPHLLAHAGSLAITGALLALCAAVVPGAPMFLWLVAGLVAALAAARLGGSLAAAISAVVTAGAAIYLAIPPDSTLKLPRSGADLWGLTLFAAGAVLVVYLARHRRAAQREHETFARATAALQDESRRRALLLRFAERALAGGSVEVLARNAAEIVVEGLGVASAAILESAVEDGTFHVTGAAGWDPPLPDRLAVDADVDSQIGYALVGREPVIVADVDAAHRFAIPAEFRRRRMRSGIAARIGPVRPQGVAAAYHFAPRTFEGAEVEFVSGVAAVLAAAYERVRMERERTELMARDELRREEAQVAARRSAFLAQTATVLDAALEPETTLVSLARLAVPAMADCAIVDLVEDEGQVRRVDVIDIDPTRREEAGALRRLSPDLRTEGPFPRAIRTGQPVLLPELTKVATHTAAEAEHYRLLTKLGCQSLLMIPLVARGQTLGLVTFASRQPYRYEAADLSLAQELAGRAAMALDNGRLHREAQAASRAKDEFLATVSHELRTPLNAVLGWAAILRGHHLDEARARHALDAIDRSVRAQARLLEQLLDVSRIVAGKFELRLAPGRLAEVIDGAIDTVRPSADERGIHVEKRLAPDVPPLTVDSDRLQQVVINLLSNAIKFTPDGGLVEVELRRTAVDAEIVVRDHGVGIKREFLPYVFDRFRQAEGASAAGKGGLGLGLSIVREIVQKHGGRVSVESEGEGKGATFRVQLPIQLAVEPLPAAAEEAPAAPMFTLWKPGRTR